MRPHLAAAAESLVVFPRPGHSKEPFRESIQQGSRPASTRGKTSAKDSEESDEESQASEAESKASKASNSKASKKGKDAEDAAGGTIEVKDPETLWKVNIEAVYRRKNPQARPCSCSILRHLAACAKALARSASVPGNSCRRCRTSLANTRPLRHH